MAKGGRTSGWTVGSVSAIRTDMGPAMHRLYGKANGDTTTCFAVLGQKSTSTFAISGDAGAVVLHHDTSKDSAEWVGLVFAGEDASNASYIVPIDVVFDDIKEVTGCDSVEPYRDRGLPLN